MLLFALLVAPVVGFATCVAISAAFPGNLFYAAGLLAAPALTAWRARRAGCSTARTWALAAASGAVAFVVVAGALLVLLVLLSAALSDFD